MNIKEKGEQLSAIRRLYIVGSILMILAVFNMPYGYYGFLRVAVLIISILACLVGINLPPVVIPSLIIGILWNPISIFYFEASTWKLLNIIALIYYIYIVYVISDRNRGTIRL